jgi:hypothetical protein
VPIAIPMGLREERDSTPDSPEEPGGIHAATFVPPHMLEQARSGALELTNSVHVRPQILNLIDQACSGALKLTNHSVHVQPVARV